MIRYSHVDRAGNGFFEGWYFKHRAGRDVLAAIPGIAIAKDGTRSAFVQCIHNAGSWVERYPAADFTADPNRLHVRVGSNEFSAAGMRLDLKQGRIRADVAYGPLGAVQRSLYAPSMMGPFGYLPFLECYHDVISDGHGVTGWARVEGREIDFGAGRGYVEKDWGRSFPRAWVWLECSDFGADVRVMAAVAEVPFLGAGFTGILCNLSLGGKRLRIATYYGARIAALRDEEDRTRLELRQGGIHLAFDVRYARGSALHAPILGDMRRVIQEVPACELRLCVRDRGRVIFQGEGRNAGFERVGELRAAGRRV